MGNGCIRRLEASRFPSRELRKGECRLFVVEHEGNGYVVRLIRTATLHVKVQLPSPTSRNPSFQKVFRLKEYHLNDGKRKYRKYDNSMSEKLAPGETYRDAAVRAIQQELGIFPEEAHLGPPHFFSMKEYPWFKNPGGIPKEEGGHLPNEPELRETPRYPGIYTNNELEHFIWHMPLEYCRPEGYHEPGTNHYFEWEETP